MVGINRYNMRQICKGMDPGNGYLKCHCIPGDKAKRIYITFGNLRPILCDLSGLFFFQYWGIHLMKVRVKQ